MFYNEYITENLEIPKEPTKNVTTLGEYPTDKRQSIIFTYDDDLCCIEQILYDAIPSCKHQIQAQWSGIKCVRCGGWYCA